MKVKTHELRKLGKADLTKKLGEFRQELIGLRVAKVGGSGGAPAKVNKIHDVRKSVARVATVISQTQRDQLRLYYKGKKYLPIDLRAKKTRAIRRKLSASEAGAKTLRQQKKDMHFPMRKYAIRA